MAIQRNWIGRSEGAEIVFRIEELGDDIPVFTTRAGHAVRRDVLRRRARAPARRGARERGGAGVRAARRREPREERAAATEKTGVFTGL